jgi:Leucine-rich repeat (LRR) protein
MITAQPRFSDTKSRDLRLLARPRHNVRFFCDIEIPDGVEQMHLPENWITDFVGLPDSDSLVDLVLDKNPIISFRGFPTLRNLQHFSLRGTPISKVPNFRALAVLCAGDQLESLNGQEVTTVDRAAAKAYQSGKPAV